MYNCIITYNLFIAYILISYNYNTYMFKDNKISPYILFHKSKL